MIATQCIGFSLNNDDDNHHQQNPYNGKNLVDDKNYQAVLDRFNQGKFYFLLIISSEAIS
jgi:hypothetical protein